MSVQKRIIIGEVGGVPAVEKNAPRQRILPEWIGIEVLHVVAALHYGVINVRSVNGDPGDHIVRYGGLLLSGGVLNGLVLCDVVAEGVAVNVIIVIHTPHNDQQHQHEHDQNEPLVENIKSFPEFQQDCLFFLVLSALVLDKQVSDTADNDSTDSRGSGYGEENAGGDCAGAGVGEINNGIALNIIIAHSIVY